MKQRLWATVAVMLNESHHLCVEVDDGEMDADVECRVEHSLWGPPAKVVGVYATPYGKTLPDGYTLKNMPGCNHWWVDGSCGYCVCSAENSGDAIRLSMAALANAIRKDSWPSWRCR